MRRSWILAAAAIVAVAAAVVVVLVVRREDGAKAAPLQGETGVAFAEVPELRSAGGVLEVTFEVADRRTTIGGREVEGRSYADGVQGPTLRLAPGDHLRLHLRNRLDQATNLHFHGMHVSPLPPGDDVLMHVPAGEEFTYEFDVPADHARGTYWYHSHQHGSSEAQVFAGLSGVLIVEGLEDLLPAALRDVPQRVLAFKDVQVAGDEVEDKNIDSNAPTTRLVNGLERPRLTAAPGETQLWRLANIGADIFYDLQLPGTSFTVVGEDGNPVWSVWSADHLVLPPGKRYDVLVQPAAGSSTLSTLAYDQGGDQYPTGAAGHARHHRFGGARRRAAGLTDRRPRAWPPPGSTGPGTSSSTAPTRTAGGSTARSST